VFWFTVQLLTEIFLIRRRIKRDMIKNVYWSSCKEPVIIVRFWETWIFFDIFSKNSQISNFMKIRPRGAELFHSDGRSDGQTWRSYLLLYAILRTRLMNNFKFDRWTMFGYPSKCNSHSFKHFGGETWGRQEQRRTKMACASFAHLVAA
jgi:hypothetical protein